MVTVQVPLMGDKPEWNLNGQTIAFTFSPQENVSLRLLHLGDRVKEHIHVECKIQLTDYLLIDAK